LDLVPEWRKIVPRDRLFSMYRSIYMSYLLSTFDDSKYDLVLRSRTDMFWHSPLTECLNNISIAENEVWVPAGNDGGFLQPGQGLCDWFAIGTPNSMAIYSSLYLNICKYVSQGVPIHPEFLLKHHLTNSGISIKRFNASYELVRQKQDALKGVN